MYRLNQSGLLGVKLDLLAQLGDVLVKGSAVGEVVHAPTFVEDGVAVEDLSYVIVEQREDLNVSLA